MLSVLLLASTPGTCAWWHGWRDQHIRVSPQLAQGIANKHRRNLAEGVEFSSDLRRSAKTAMAHAEEVHDRHRRGLMTATPGANGTRDITVNDETFDLTNFDCLWVDSLHAYAAPLLALSHPAPHPGSPAHPRSLGATRVLARQIQE